MCTLLRSRSIHKFLVSLVVVMSLFAGFSQAKMISTDAVINSNGEHYTQQQLQSALASDELKQQLTVMGVDTEQLNDRLASLTPGEVQQLNAELADQPAGGVLGVLLTVFIVLLVTDMLCATDVFSFVRCIN